MQVLTIYERNGKRYGAGFKISNQYTIKEAKRLLRECFKDCDILYVKVRM